MFAPQNANTFNIYIQTTFTIQKCSSHFLCISFKYNNENSTKEFWCSIYYYIKFVAIYIAVKIRSPLNFTRNIVHQN